MAEAIRVSERTRATLRRWISSGELQRFEGELPSRGGSRPALISRAELLAVLVKRGQAPRSPAPPADDPPRPPVTTADDPPRAPGGDPPAELLEARAEIARLRSAAQLAEVRAEMERERVKSAAAVESAQLTGQLAEARARLEAMERLHADVRQQLAAAHLEREEWKGLHHAVRAELDALRRSAGLSWWRRLLTTKEG